MDINPFTYDRPVRSSQIIDREDELIELRKLVLDIRNVRVSAPRRYGKTSLLYALRDVLEKDGVYFIYIDTLVATSIADVNERLIRALSSVPKAKKPLTRLLRSWNVEFKAGLPGLTVSSTPSIKTIPSTGLLDELLELPERLADADNTSSVLVFDEFQDIMQSQDDLDARLRSVIQHHQRVAYVFSGSHAGLLEKLFSDRRRAFYAQAHPIELGPLPLDVLEDYIEGCFDSSSRQISVEALSTLTKFTQGHPQRSMWLAALTWDLTERNEKINEDDIEKAYERVLSFAQPEFEATWAGLSGAPNKRKALRGLALHPDVKPYASELLNAVGLSKTGMQQALPSLQREGLVRKDVNNRWYVVDPLLAAWLRRH